MMWWYGGPVGGWNGYGLGWGGGWIMMIIGILGFFFVLWGIIMIIRWFTMDNRWSDHTYHRYYNNRSDNDEAISALKIRYARGEISKEEYEKILRDLKNN